MNLTNKQLSKIHTLKTKKGISEENYRDALLSYGVKSSKSLTKEQAAHFISVLEGKPQRKKYAELEGRYEYLATPAQLRYIEKLWEKIARDKSKDALRAFIKSKVDVDDVTFLTKQKAAKIIYILQKMEEA